MDSKLTVEKLLRRSTATSKIDFDDLVRKHGFIKARQLIKRSTIQQHQQDVEEEEKNVHASHEQQRIRETMLLSTTHGGSSNLSMLDKLQLANRGITAVERSLLDNNFGVNSMDLLRSIKQHERKDISQDQFLREDKIHYALTSSEKELLIANADIEELPLALSDTLHLQTAYLRKINCTRNQIKTLTSSNMPQFSFYHLRYVKSINLSLNKIKRLPDNFGALKFLEELNLSDNMLSKLPASVLNLKSLTTLDLSCNNFVSLPDEFSNLSSLTNLNLSQNLFISFPYPVCRLISIKVFKFSRNTLNNLAILPPLLKKEDMFIKTYDQWSGKTIFVNILTKEKVSHIEKYSGAGLKRQHDIHTFQSEDPKNVLHYRRRKMWLSVCQINEWDPDFDVATGQLYYKNNVSGSTSWDMPDTLDNIGLMSTLEEFEIKNNAIKFLPNSFSTLLNLKRVAFTRNRLKELPEEIGNLKLLEYLDLSSNELKLIPVSICSCTELKELHLDDNHLIRLPEDLGLLPKLERLILTANRLKKVPFSLGYCKTLKSIRVAENPIEDPPIEEFDKNIEHVLWYLRNKFMIEKHGMPPMMEYHTIGINNEVTILKQELLETVYQKIEASKKDGILNLQLLGLKEIPKLVLKMPKLHRLKLDFNDRLQISEFPIEFKNIDGLSFKSCKMPNLPENIYIFERLSSLNLEDNRLEFLPKGIVEIFSLTNLNLSKNRLYNLPEDFHRLKHLQMLNLESNYIEELPIEMGKMTKMKNLNLAKNRLYDIPETLCDMKGLKVLNLEKNRLRYLPSRISQMELVELRIGHNQIERLTDDMFARRLGKTIEFFSCVENNMMDLPNSLGNVKERCVLEADYNPFVSPPPYLLSEGFKVVQHYLQIRHMRRQLLYQLIVDEDFELSMNSFSPFACEVLEDGTGFLTPEDLAAFDQAVHEYCNGEYYKCPATAEEIVGRLVSLREERETELYLVILRTFLKVVKRLVDDADPLFKNSTIFSAQRPWGKDGESCNVWVISLAALLRDQPPNNFYPDGRPSIFNLIASELPPISFPFTVDLLKDSMRLYQSPYGQVADTERVTFPACDCIDEARNKPKRHMPCIKPAVVLVKAVYVEEEATRRDIEEEEFLERFEEVEDEIRIWFATEEGKRELDKEVRRRKQVLREEISLRDEMIMSLTLKMKKSVDNLHRLEKRKALFEEGAGIEMHGFNNINEAIQQIANTKDEVDATNEKANVLTEAVKKLKDELNLDWKVAYVKAMEDLVHKYCALSYEKAVYAFRRHAIQHNLNRHWDGDDGDAFELWKRRNVVFNADGTLKFSEDPDPDNEEEAEAATNEENEGNKEKPSKPKDLGLAPEYDWQNTDDMAKYKLNIYGKYRKQRGGIPLIK